MFLPTFTKPVLYEVPHYLRQTLIGTLNRKTKRKKAMANFRIVDKRKSLRNRECFNCGHTILKGADYLTVQVRYDKRTITLNKCINCTDKGIFELPKTFMKLLNQITTI